VNHKSSEREDEKIRDGGGRKEDGTLDSNIGMTLSVWLGGGHGG